MKVVVECSLVERKIIAVDLDISLEHLDLEGIIKSISLATSISVDFIKSKVRNREFVNCRKLYSLIARRYTKKSLANIGKPIQVDHATVLYYIREAKQHYEREPDFRQQYQESVGRLGNHQVVRPT